MNAIPPKPLSASEETVTLKRSDWEAFLSQIEEQDERASVAAAMAERERLGAEEYRRLSYTAAEMARMLDGVAPLTIWRERGGLSQRQLALKAGTIPSYVSEIEAGKKPGSASVLLRLARVLDVPMDLLVDEPGDEHPAA